jgi:hypothetical protein
MHGEQINKPMDDWIDMFNPTAHCINTEFFMTWIATQICQKKKNKKTKKKTRKGKKREKEKQNM